MAVLEWISAGSQLLNAIGGLNGQSAAPGNALSGNAGATAVRSDVDFSGFTVATGQARADGAKISKTNSDATGIPSAAQSLSSVSPGLLLAGAAALGLVWRFVNSD